MGYVSARVRGVAGVKAIGLPVLEPRGGAVAALAVAAITQRMSLSRQAELVDVVRSEIQQAEVLLRDGNIEVTEA
jgi:DNA-binding IclR family transcriptional regulator